MMLYYLVNSVETKSHKYFRNGSDIGGERYDGTNRLLDATGLDGVNTSNIAQKAQTLGTILQLLGALNQ